jgi:hypothetical protein
MSKEQQTKLSTFFSQREVEGQLIFNKTGQTIGLAMHDGSFDYASAEEKAETVLVIRKPKKKHYE